MMSEPQPLSWFNGQCLRDTQISLSVYEPALLYGATVFTTVRIYEETLDHPLTAWQAHCDRTLNAIHAFRWFPPNWSQVEQGARLLAHHYPIVRVTLFPDGRELITGRSLPEDLAHRQQQGITAWVAPAFDYQRSLPHHKTGNYLSCWLALQEARRQNAEEAILIDADGHWQETSTGNLWGWDGQQWWTPPLAAGILPGVVRSQIQQHLQQQGYGVCEIPWTPDQCPQFDVLAYSNSAVQMIPIHTVLAGQIRLEYSLDQTPLAELRSTFASLYGNA